MTDSTEELCWCGHPKEAHTGGQWREGSACCALCTPCVDGGAKSAEDADRINNECIKNGRMPYAFWGPYCTEYVSTTAFRCPASGSAVTDG